MAIRLRHLPGRLSVEQESASHARALVPAVDAIPRSRADSRDERRGAAYPVSGQRPVAREGGRAQAQCRYRAREGGRGAAGNGVSEPEEVLEALTLKQLGYHRKAIAVLDLDGFFDPLWTQFQQGSTPALSNQNPSTFGILLATWMPCSDTSMLTCRTRMDRSGPIAVPSASRTDLTRRW